jgi:heme/copper-type cytochrome/quinol oxidase subunit 2
MNGIILGLQVFGFQAGSIPMFPEQASTLAPRVDALYIFLWALTAFFFVLISSILTYFVIKYRRCWTGRAGDVSGVTLMLLIVPRR